MLSVDKARFFFCALLCTGLLASGVAAENPQVIGTAYGASSGRELLYRELHFCDADKTSCTVEYRNPHNDLIALKHLDYSDSAYAPGVLMTDYRRDAEFSIGPSAQDNVVIDAGFDNYVRARWDELASGEFVDFKFWVVGLKRPLNMQAELFNEGPCAGENLCLQVGIDSWILGAIIDPIELVYSRDTRRLKRFYGVSNLRTAQGKSFKVDILYDYPEDTTLVAIPVELQERAFYF